MQTIPTRQFACHLTTCAVALCCLLAAIGAQAAGKTPVFLNYRDLKVYTFSAPDANNPAKILARTQLVNEGKTAVKISARLDSSPTLKITGGKYAGSIPAGKSADWKWSFLAPEGFTHEILTGAIDIGGRRERDLYVTLQGADPPGFDGKFVEVVTERARAVATYAPRTRASIRAEMKALEARRPKPVLTLAADGKTDYTIVVDALFLPKMEGDALADWRKAALTDVQQYLVTAVDDLQRCVKLQSGAVLPVKAAATGPAIILRFADPEAGTELHDAYRLRTDGADVIIEAMSPEAARNGVYGLLTDYLDCHWFQPKELGEEIIIPRDRTVRLPALDEVKGSRWFSTAGASWGVPPAWNMRNRAVINRGRMTFGHSWENYINNGQYPQDKFPQYYARDREGKIRNPGYTNFCSTNPEVIEIVAKKVNAYFANNPDAIVASLDPNDYAPMCLCDNCLALDKQYGQTREDGTQVADRLLHFSNEIYQRLEPRFKDKHLGILVYGFQMDLPKSAKGHSHHAGMICDMTWEYDHSRPFNDPTSKRNQVFYNLVKGWGSAIPDLGFYDYYGHFFFFGPWGMVHKMREDLPALRELGGTFVMPEAQPIFAAQGLNHYITDRLFWDLDADVDLLMEEFFTKYYGPAAEPMRDYWLAIERIYGTERAGYDPLFRFGENPATWTELDGYLEQARRIVADLPAEDKRFADRVTIASDGLEYGRLRYGYDSYYWVIAWANLGRKVDHAAGIEYLKQHGARMEELQKKYSMEDPYWPSLVANYFLLNSAAETRGHQDALAKEAEKKKE